MVKKTIKDIDVKNKKVLVRVGFNMPIKEDGSIGGGVYRIQATIPTIEYLLEQNCSVVLISHMGRPEGKNDPKLSLRPTAEKLSGLIGKPVEFVEDCVGPAADSVVRDLKSGEVVMLENLRFHKEEEKNDDDFASKLASHGEIFVQDSFDNVHREHASMVAITKHLPSVAGLLVEKEFDILSAAIENPAHPLLAIIGGAKVSTKIDVVQALGRKAEKLIIAGAMANTFFLDERYGFPLGRSIREEEMAEEVSDIIDELGDKLILPDSDVGVAKDVSPEAERHDKDIREVEEDDIILDFGSNSISQATAPIWTARTVIWNGPVGMVELPKFAEGTHMLADAIASSSAKSIIGGGDTAAYLDELGIIDKFDHVSTGGGSSLELMAQHPLPGIDALETK